MIIAQGAEAVISKENNKIIKDRIKKSYRIPEIDLPLRKQRTRTEAKLLSEARRCGVPTPQVLEVTDTKIIMEEIAGQTVKDFLINCEAAKGNISAEHSKIAYNIGQLIARLHKAGIVHGDLTTSNMILEREEGRGRNHRCLLFFIDFGLGFFSTRTEDYAQDLAVLKQAIKATHFPLFRQLWKEIEKAYSNNNVFKVLEAIEKRGRYIERSV